MDKQALRNRMLDLERAELDDDQGFFADFVAGSELDGETQMDHDGESRAEQSADLAAALENPIAAHGAKIERLQDIDFGPKTSVEEGAAVLVEGRWLVVAVATTEFDFDGDPCLGISATAPVFEQMQGLAAGDRFRMGGRERLIEAVA
ncbi:hypothetical protein [Mangrovicoccus sp. HB161399]|uniref:hypothetical protein n=1 Tax=Mangrovicoccus sp. HB161399 TaxID=2720392 RepID=UPI0015539CB2|nr:hypothetical protein [Mangrovicoccus sp. HB161399]